MECILAIADKVIVLLTPLINAQAAPSAFVGFLNNLIAKIDFNQIFSVMSKLDILKKILGA